MQPFSPCSPMPSGRPAKLLSRSFSGSAGSGALRTPRTFPFSPRALPFSPTTMGVPFSPWTHSPVPSFALSPSKHSGFTSPRSTGPGDAPLSPTQTLAQLLDVYPAQQLWASEDTEPCNEPIDHFRSLLVRVLKDKTVDFVDFDFIAAFLRNHRHHKSFIGVDPPSMDLENAEVAPVVLEGAALLEIRGDDIADLLGVDALTSLAAFPIIYADGEVIGTVLIYSDRSPCAPLLPRQLDVVRDVAACVGAVVAERIRSDLRGVEDRACLKVTALGGLLRHIRLCLQRWQLTRSACDSTDAATALPTATEALRRSVEQLQQEVERRLSVLSTKAASSAKEPPPLFAYMRASRASPAERLRRIFATATGGGIIAWEYDGVMTTSSPASTCGPIDVHAPSLHLLPADALSLMLQAFAAARCPLGGEVSAVCQVQWGARAPGPYTQRGVRQGCVLLRCVGTPADSAMDPAAWATLPRVLAFVCAAHKNLFANSSWELNATGELLLAVPLLVPHAAGRDPALELSPSV